MDFLTPLDILQIATEFKCEIHGDTSDDLDVVKGLNEINRVRKYDLCFVDAAKYYTKAIKSKASFIIIPEKVDCPPDKVLLIHETPFEVYNSIAKTQGVQYLLKENKIHESALIEENVFIGKNVQIGSGTYIQSGAYIGNNVTIGNNVEIHAGAKIGTDAFYLHKNKAGEITKWYSCGQVVIEDYVSIGANTTINQAVSHITRIGKGTKIDCLVQIAHGVEIGENCVIAAQVGISGKTILGDSVTIYGQVGITQNVVIGDRVTVFAQSGVSSNLAEGKTYFGSPAMEMRDKLTELKTVRRIVRRENRGDGG